MKLKHGVIDSPASFFAVIASLFGVIFLLIIPPFQTPDEYIHFYRAYETSELKLPMYSELNKAAGSFLPKSIKETENSVRGGAGEIRYNPREKYDQRLTKHALFNISLNEDQKIFYDTVSLGPQYHPISYAPQALVVAAARLFDSPVVLMIYLVRLVNLMVWITVGYFAIKIFPWKRWALVAILLLPTMVAQSISTGLDVFTYGSALLFISLVFRAISDPKRIVGRREIILTTIAATFMVFGKITCAVLLPLLLFIKPKQLGSLYIWLRALMMTIPLMLYAVWSILTKNILPAGQNASSSQQIQSIFDNPLIFPVELFSTLFFVWGDTITQSLIGNFGWLDTPLSAPFVCLGVVLLAFVLLVNYEDTNLKSFSKSQKMLASLMATAYFTGVALAMYVYSSENSLRFITGIQGRYFIPLLVLFIPILYTNRIKMRGIDFKRVVQCLSIALLIVSSLTIFFRYYVIYFPMV